MKANLKTWRERRQFSQEGLARAVNVSTRTIWTYEKKGMGNANVHTLAAIAMALDIDINNLDLELDKEEM